MNPDFPNATKSFRTLNPLLFRSELPSEGHAVEEAAVDAVRPDLEQRTSTRTSRKKLAEKEDTGRFLVRVTSVRTRLVDEDNLCEKYVVDCCRYAGLIPEDCPGRTKIEVAQRKAEKGEEPHTEIEIHYLL